MLGCVLLLLYDMLIYLIVVLVVGGIMVLWVVCVWLWFVCFGVVVWVVGLGMVWGLFGILLMLWIDDVCSYCLLF